VIRSFADDYTECFWRTGTGVAGVPANVAKRKLLMLDSATELRDVSRCRGNRLERLHGNREGQWSIRINDQYRVCFRWQDGDAFDVEITDYH
jgi:proteic killer suppression protein